MLYDLVIVGGGPAGIASAIYAARAGLRSAIVEKEFCGGKINYTSEISNYPGFVSISGVDLSNKMFECVKSLDVEFKYGEVVDSNLGDAIKTLALSDGSEFESQSVVVATGLKTRFLKCKGEDRLKGKGVSYCATCDGFFFKNKKVVVVGGGNTALEDALYLSGICKEVTILVRKNFLRGDKILSDAVEHNNKIHIMFETVIEEIIGEDKVEKVLIKSKGKTSEMAVDAVFIAIGQEPGNDAFREIESNELGYFVSNEDCLTNLDGVFVAGDCREKSLRQIVTAVSDGAIAASQSIKFLKKSKMKYASTKI